MGVRKIGNLARKMFAALVLRAMARELAEKGIKLAAAERYLVLEDYIRPSSPNHNAFWMRLFGV